MSTTATADRLLTRTEAAEMLGIQPQTLATWHSTGRYSLPVVHVGRHVRYRESDILRRMADRTSTSTAAE